MLDSSFSGIGRQAARLTCGESGQHKASPSQRLNLALVVGTWRKMYNYIQLALLIATVRANFYNLKNSTRSKEFHTVAKQKRSTVEEGNRMRFFNGQFD